jgi:hypothetical protein
MRSRASAGSTAPPCDGFEWSSALWLGPGDDPALEHADRLRHLISKAMVDQPLSTV